MAGNSVEKSPDGSTSKPARLRFYFQMICKAIRSFYGLETSIKRAISAGVDVIVFGNNSVYQPDIVPQAIGIIKNLIDQGEITEERIDESYHRVLRAKQKLTD